MSSIKRKIVHYRTGSRRTRCGIPLKSTKYDTLLRKNITCKRCLRSIRCSADA